MIMPEKDYGLWNSSFSHLISQALAAIIETGLFCYWQMLSAHRRQYWTSYDIIQDLMETLKYHLETKNYIWKVLSQSVK